MLHRGKNHKFMRRLLIITAFAFGIFALCSLKSMDEKLNEINDCNLDLAISYDMLAYSLASNLPGCD